MNEIEQLKERVEELEQDMADIKVNLGVLHSGVDAFLDGSYVHRSPDKIRANPLEGYGYYRKPVTLGSYYKKLIK